MTMLKYNFEQRSFAKVDDSKERRRPVKQIGTMTISIPTRKLRVDRKGRKRRISVKFELPLMSGPGTLTARSVIANLQKDLQNTQKIPLTQKAYRKIVQAFEQ